MIEQKLRTDFFKKIKWNHSQAFKPSMTFIQNVHYRNAHHFYNEILKSEGIDIAVFGLYDKAISYGLREMPQVYELWCLVTLIKVLQEDFHFKPNKDDIKTLLKIIDPKRQKIDDYVKINFTGSLAGREVTLHYQKKNLIFLKLKCQHQVVKLLISVKLKKSQSN